MVLIGNALGSFILGSRAKNDILVSFFNDFKHILVMRKERLDFFSNRYYFFLYFLKSELFCSNFTITTLNYELRHL